MDHMANWLETEVERVPVGEEHRRGRASTQKAGWGLPKAYHGFRDTARVQEPPDIFEAPWQKSDQQMGRFSENRRSPTLLLNS